MVFKNYRMFSFIVQTFMLLFVLEMFCCNFSNL